MSTLRINKTSADTGAAGASVSADKWALTRAARQVASSPVSLYLWLSGPALTKLDRERADLAYAEGAQGRGALIV